VLPFVMYAVQGFVDGLRQQLQEIRAQQWDVAWRNFVDEQFRDEKTGAPIRQRDLVLDLPAQPDWVNVADIPALSPRLARAYAGKGAKTITPRCQRSGRTRACRQSRLQGASQARRDSGVSAAAQSELAELVRTSIQKE